MEGICHICGAYGKLSYEHVPPSAAFNDKPVLYTTLLKILQRGDLDGLTGKKLQRGAGANKLCEKCNATTGHWYGAAFADWAYQGDERANHVNSSFQYFSSAGHQTSYLHVFQR
jgi:hypothetical protein